MNCCAQWKPNVIMVAVNFGLATVILRRFLLKELTIQFLVPSASKNWQEISMSIFQHCYYVLLQCHSISYLEVDHREEPNWVVSETDQTGLVLKGKSEIISVIYAVLWLVRPQLGWVVLNDSTSGRSLLNRLIISFNICDEQSLICEKVDVDVLFKSLNE